MAYEPVIALKLVPPNQGRLIEIDDQRIALFLSDGQLFAIDDTCPHRGGSLHQGECVGMQVICPLHPAAFDLRTGQHLCPPAESDLRVYPVRVVGGIVEIDSTGGRMES